MVDVSVYFNFRSPYCYLASKAMFAIFDDYDARLVWKPLGGWNGRSHPDRAKFKLPITRQDVGRISRRMGIPFVPPPMTTDPTGAAAGSLLAEREGVLRPYIVEMMRAEWAEGLDIGQPDMLLDVGERVGLDRDALASESQSDAHLAILAANWEEAQGKGAFGVPTFVVDDQVFWGNDRIDYVREHLHNLRLVRA